MATYFEKLRDPRWQKVRLRIMERTGFKCELCGSEDKTLNVHHGYYERGYSPWEYRPETLWCLCEECHEFVQDGVRDLHFEIAKIHPDNFDSVMAALIQIRGSQYQRKFGNEAENESVLVGEDPLMPPKTARGKCEWELLAIMLSDPSTAAAIASRVAPSLFKNPLIANVALDCFSRSSRGIDATKQAIIAASTDNERCEFIERVHDFVFSPHFAGGDVPPITNEWIDGLCKFINANEPSPEKLMDAKERLRASTEANAKRITRRTEP